MAKTQWHPAFCAAVRLELRGNPTLKFTDGFQLTEKPLEVDLLVVNKPADVKIRHPIGEFFREHNILEYKSPTDHGFNGYAIFQALSYAYYYGDRYQTEDITVSLVVSRAHFDLMKWLDGKGVRCERRHAGIYTVYGTDFLRMQVIVTEELDAESNRWLAVLTDRLTEARARDFVATARNLTERDEKRLAEAITQVLSSANTKLFEKMKEDDIMASALMELMRPEVEKYAQQYAVEYAQNYAKEHAKEKDIKNAKKMIRHGDDNAYIRYITDMTDQEIDELRKELQKENAE